MFTPASLLVKQIVLDWRFKRPTMVEADRDRRFILIGTEHEQFRRRCWKDTFYYKAPTAFHKPTVGARAFNAPHLERDWKVTSFRIGYV